MLPDSFVVTLDVFSVYTNIPYDEGIRACEEYLNSQESLAPPTADLCLLIRLVLSMNSFVFNDTCYVQIPGTAMGTLVAPLYPNLFQGKLEHEFQETHNKLP